MIKRREPHVLSFYIILLMSVVSGKKSTETVTATEISCTPIVASDAIR